MREREDRMSNMYPVKPNKLVEIKFGLSYRSFKEKYTLLPYQVVFKI